MSFADILQGLDARDRAKLERKMPSWAGAEVNVPASINLEQCSSETAAVYKAGLVAAGARVADLTGGLGADSWAFSRRASRVWYNERDSVLLEAVKRNFAALGVDNVSFSGYDVSAESDGWKTALTEFAPDAIYLDPARRNSAGRKVFLLEDCSPDVVSLMPQLLKLAPLVMVKVSPMADLTMLQRRLAGYISELHVVGADGECKEVLCICRRSADAVSIRLVEDGWQFSERQDSGETDAGGVSGNHRRPWRPRRADVPWGTSGGEFASQRREGPTLAWEGRSEAEVSGGTTCAVEPESAGSLLFVPSAALTKSGLGPGISLMEYDAQLAHFGKFWQVVENLPFASSAIKDLSRRCPQAEVTARGVQLSSEELRRKLGAKPGGKLHIFACNLGGERRLLVCKAE